MAEVTFYHQERVDGGRRSGVTVDGETVLHGFIPGSNDDYDPALEWYVDVSLTTANPPTQTSALGWLNDRKPEIEQALAETAEVLSTGIDADSMPAEFERNGTDGRIRVTVSAMRRLVGRRVGEKLLEFARMDWGQLFPVLTPQG
jgi:hypothetical protein